MTVIISAAWKPVGAILVDTVIRDHAREAYEAISVIIEIKGCWNETLGSAMQTQLAERYLRDNQCQYGLYVVGWFNCNQWDGKTLKLNSILQREIWLT